MSTEVTKRPFSRLKQAAQILKMARKLKKDGLLQPGMTSDEVQDLIVAGLLDGDPVTYAGADFDWQALIDLIIQLLPLIFMLFL